MHKHRKMLLPQAQVTLPPNPPPMWPQSQSQSQSQSQVLDLVEASPSPQLWLLWHLSITTLHPCRSCHHFLPDSYCYSGCVCSILPRSTGGPSNNGDTPYTHTHTHCVLVHCGEGEGNSSRGVSAASVHMVVVCPAWLPSRRAGR